MVDIIIYSIADQESIEPQHNAQANVTVLSIRVLPLTIQSWQAVDDPPNSLVEGQQTTLRLYCRWKDNT